uniref:Uncharacterized protein n=1 Tax=Ditylum brightwellii TaxID=49249 RepID=A0A7S2ENM3_9STRA|mmetsp:Transcript_3766/g.5814  ORF Transcript_3766/g.5814 Transcript_3766/m.5814 type:complete len:634 (+) Transcript_3766:1251-3152(+)
MGIFSKKKGKTKSFHPTLLHLVLPYLIGITWTCLHPILSVITGELKCRGSYLDESALSSNRFTIPNHDYGFSVLTVDESGNNEAATSLCDVLNTHRFPTEQSSILSSPAIDCLIHPSSSPKTPSLEIVKIIPSSSSIQPSESIVLILTPPPTSSSWTASTFHSCILTLLHRLSTSKTTWLSKIIYVVTTTTSPSSSSTTSIQDTVATYLQAHHGIHHALPLDYSNTMIRTLLVYNISYHSSSSAMTEVQILPQGEYGALPNLDLVFTVNGIMKYYNGYEYQVPRHYTWNVDKMEKFGGKVMGWIATHVGWRKNKVEAYVRDFVGMLSFAGHLAIGPYPPHAQALKYGIDSLTIQSTFPSSSSSSSSHSSESKMVQQIEQTINTLAYTHERLHHSITQYILPSSTKFVGQSEYIYPMILILIGLVIKAITLAFMDIGRFCFEIGIKVTLCVVGGVSLLMMCFSLDYNDDSYGELIMYGYMYAVVLSLIGCIIPLDNDKNNKREEEKVQSKHWINENWKQSIQFVACIIAIYTHVPMMLSHVSLAYPSALFWCPLLTFPSYGNRLHHSRGGDADETKKTVLLQMKQRMTKIASILILILTWPPVLLVPKVFEVYTMYILLVYTPLHMFLATLWLF